MLLTGSTNIAKLRGRGGSISDWAYLNLGGPPCAILFVLLLHRLACSTELWCPRISMQLLRTALGLNRFTWLSSATECQSKKIAFSLLHQELGKEGSFIAPVCIKVLGLNGWGTMKITYVLVEWLVVKAGGLQKWCLTQILTPSPRMGLFRNDEITRETWGFRPNGKGKAEACWAPPG